VRVHVLGLDHLLQALLELGEDLLDRVLEVVGRGRGRGVGQRVDLSGQLRRQIERVALGASAMGSTAGTGIAPVSVSSVVGAAPPPASSASSRAISSAARWWPGKAIITFSRISRASSVSP
jgi:hypothetical protein